jgi:hypothetical protein
MADGLQVKVKRTGRLRKPNLDNGPLTAIGNEMVKAQLARWAASIDAEGNKAKWLTMKYVFIKQKFTGVNRPKRDNKMTGALVKNFTLRKATAGVIRAEPTQRLTRLHAMRSQGYEEMIGFAGNDQLVVFRGAEREYGNFLKTAWVPVSG